MSDDDRASPTHRGLRDRVKFFERVWTGTSTDSDVVDATTSVDDIEKRLREEQRKKKQDATKIEVKLKHTDRESPTRTFESTFPSLKLRHVEQPVEETVERHVEEGDLAAGVRFVKFERLTVKRTVTETRELVERPESPQHEWYSEYRQHALHNAPKKDYLRSKSEYDSHIAEIRGNFSL